MKNSSNYNSKASASKRYRRSQLSTPRDKRSKAEPSNQSQFLRRRTVDRDTGIPSGVHSSKRPPRASTMIKGNLGNSKINPALVEGPKIKTNSPKQFQSGPKVRIIPMGGSGEVGMNMNAIECGDDILLIDTGFGFGGNQKYPGVDYIIPNTEYLEQNRHKIRGLIYTHGHLDHIGGAPYILPKIGSISIYGMALTLELLKVRLQEFELDTKFFATVIDLNKTYKIGCFEVDFFILNHTIPDVVGLSINTPMGRIVYCTDWKFDNTPFNGQLSDYGKLAKIGDEGVRLLMTDSLGILKPGTQISEREIYKTVDKLFYESKERIIFTTFSTSIARMQHVINACEKYNRKLALVGRSMLNNFNICYRLGHIRVPSNLIVDIKDADRVSSERLCVLCTGSQGEDAAALNRMARDEHKQVKLQGGDTVIFSSGVIPGNEDSVQDLTAKLSRKGVTVYNYKEMDLHVSGHACQEDLKLMFSLTRPDYLQPMHGDHYMIKKTCELGASVGIPHNQLIVSENGRITEMNSESIVLTEDVISENCYLVDGTGFGAVSEVVLEERRQMATQGTLILVILVDKQKKLIAGPEIISRGFVYMKNSQTLFEEIKQEVRKIYSNIGVDPKATTFYSETRSKIRNQISDFLFNRTEKQPIIIPVIVQV